MISRKHYLGIAGMSAIVIAVIFSATVMAAGPAQSWLNVLIKNTPAEAVPVTVQGTVAVDDSEGINVYVQGTVPVDVSGWLHTTNTGYVQDVLTQGQLDRTLDHLNTTGYRQITLRIVTLSGTSNCEYSILYDIGGETYRNATDVMSEWPKIYNVATGGFQEILVMDVFAQGISVDIHNYLGPETPVYVYWYLTT